MSKVPYSPKSHFFVDHSNLIDPNPSNISTDAFGPVNGDETNKYRTTSVIRTSNESKVFAICDGHILIQPQAGDDTKVNLILRPSESYAPFKIKYFIYRGVNKVDLINNDIMQTVNDSDPNQPLFLKKIWQQFIDYNLPLYEAGIIDTPPESFPSFLIGYNPSNQTNDSLINSYFFNSDNNEVNFYQLPKCNKGEYLGNFTGEIGLDIVLDYGDYELDYEEQLFKLDLEYARKKEHVFDITTITGTVKQKRYREYIHQFIDAAAFWGSHIDAGEIVLFNEVKPAGISGVDFYYEKVVSKYQTKNKLYLYVQSERGRSYNYHTNSGQISLDIQGTNPPVLVDYKATDGAILTDWPILIKSITPSSTEVKEFQFSFHYSIDTSIHSTDIHLSAYCIFPNWKLENFITTNQLLITTDPFPGTPDHVRPFIPTRNGQSKLIQKIPIKSIDVSGNFKLVSNLLLIVVNENQPTTFLNFYDDLWQINIKEAFTLLSGANNLCHWSSQIKNKNIELSGINIKNVTVNTRIITDQGKNVAGTVEERKLYQSIFNNVIGGNEDFQTTKGINSAFEKNLQKSNYGTVFFNNPKCRIYKGTLDDGGTIVDSIHLVNEDNYYLKRKIVQIGILTKEYNKLIYDSEIIPDTSASGYIPFIDDPANIYFHLEEDTSIPTSKKFRKFKLGLKYEDNAGNIAIKFPTNDIFVYTIDDFTFFTKEYTNYQEFYEEQPKCNVKFRVKLPYTGNFGFDWMRINDNPSVPVSGDVDYKNHIGKLYTDAVHTIIETDSNKYIGHFKKHNEFYKKLEFDYNPFPVQFTTSHNVEKYYVPLLAIHPPYVIPTLPLPDLDRQNIFTAPYNDDINRLAELTLKIEVTSEPVRLEFDYDTTKLNIAPTVIPKTIGSHTPNISVRCTTEFATEQLIKIIAYYNDSSGVIDPIGKMVGVLRVKPNSKFFRRSKKILLIDVITDITGLGTPTQIFSIEEQAKFLKKFLRQTLSTPIIETITIDLVSNPDAVFSSNFIGTNAFGDKYLKSDNSGLWMLDHLYDWLTTSGPTPVGTAIYTDYFKAFMFHDNGILGRFGYSQPWNDFLADFPNIYPSTTTHEFLHTANVPHTFANYEATKYAKFTYEPLFTDSIMDYSDFGASPPIPTISIYDWQGEVAKKEFDPEP